MQLNGIRGQDRSLTLAKSYSDFKIKTCFFSETSGSFETKFHIKTDRRMGIKIYKNDLVT